MLKLTQAAILVTLLAGGAAQAADTKILDRHVANMKMGNPDGVLADYAPDAVIVTPAGMITPSGVFVGAEARKLFSVLTDKDHVSGNKTMQTRYETLGAVTTKMSWVQYKGTPKEVSGYDIFVVRGGKVVFQSVIVDAAKK